MELLDKSEFPPNCFCIIPLEEVENKLGLIKYPNQMQEIVIPIIKANIENDALNIFDL